MKNIVFIPEHILCKKSDHYLQKIARQILIQWYERSLGSITFLSFQNDEIKKAIVKMQKTLFFTDSKFLQTQNDLFKCNLEYQNMFDIIVTTIESADTIIFILSKEHYQLIYDVMHEHLNFTKGLHFLLNMKIMYLLESNLITPLIPAQGISLVA